MAKNVCNKDHSNIINILQNLPESQAVIRGRHRCAGCAYVKGVQDTLEAIKRALEKFKVG